MLWFIIVKIDFNMNFSDIQQNVVMKLSGSLSYIISEQNTKYTCNPFTFIWDNEYWLDM